MAGFLVIGLSIPHAFGAVGAHGRDGLALGLGYLVVVSVHSLLYLRVNRNIGRILPFNLTSPVLVIIAGLTLWWAFFGTGDDDQAQEALTGASPDRRPVLVLAAYFYAYIPMLLGIAATAAGLRNAIGHPGATLPAGPAIALAGGVTLFLAGDAGFRRVLGIGSPRYRALAAVLALAAWPLSVAVAAAAGIAMLTAIVAAALAMESRARHATVEA